MLVKSLQIICLLLLSSVLMAQQNMGKGFKPFETPSHLTPNKSFQQPSHQWLLPQSSADTYEGGLNLFSSQTKGYSVQRNQNNPFGDEIIMGMKFSDLLSFRLNILDHSEPFSVFSGLPLQTQGQKNDGQLGGFQFGVSSVVNIGDQWKLGFDMGKGQINGDMLGLYEDHLNTTRLGLGIRYNQFGATVNSDYFSRASTDLLEQSTLDIKVDWHFTKDGTISFGARKSVNENNGASILDQLTGTVPYIKFKHNL